MYDKNTLVKIAKRHNNNKRAYLLVNPLQGKHLPANPAEALAMMRALGELTKKHAPKAKALIAMAETATAIGAAAARELGLPDIFFVTTTRESLTGEVIEFQEEHSHAVKQRLYIQKAKEPLEKAEEIIILDDEISTGRTLINMARVLRAHFPKIKRIIAASIINRVSAENEDLLAAENIVCVSLLKLPYEDYSPLALSFPALAPTTPPAPSGVLPRFIRPLTGRINPRLGANIGAYWEECEENARFIAKSLESSQGFPHEGKILVLGTEECMLPALILADLLAKKFPGAKVFNHATTRSPIAVSAAAGYPIRRGFSLPSFYDAARQTYIYNTEKYAAAVVASDAPTPSAAAVDALCGALAETEKIFLAVKN